MAAYIFVNIEVKDPDRYAEYIRMAPPSIAQFGGSYIARGGRSETLEGTAGAKRVVLLKFDTYERAKAWWSSDEYAAARALRRSCAAADMILVEGI